MSALVVLIAASLILASGFLFAFIRATKKGQYEDVYTPSVRILFEDRQNTTSQTNLTNKTSLTNIEDEFEPSVPFTKNDQSQTTKKWN